MARHLPPLNALRAFEAAGRHQSFTRAAGELNVTHAAVSRHIRGLERRLHVQLFRPVARGVRLTKAGARFLLALTPAFDQIADAVEALSGPQETTVTVSCEPTFAVKWLMPRLGGFHMAHPDFEVRIDASPRLADIERYECDVAVRFFSGEDERLALDKICHSPVYPYGARALKGRRRKPFAPEELLQMRLLHDSEGELWKRWFAAVGLPDVAVDPPRSPGSLGTLLAIESALAGQGLVLVSEELVLDDLKSGRLVRFSDTGLHYGGYYLIYLSETIRRRPVRAFRDWLLHASEALRREG